MEPEIQALIRSDPGIARAYDLALKGANALLVEQARRPSRPRRRIVFRAIHSAGEFARLADEARGVTHTAAARSSAFAAFLGFAKGEAKIPTSAMEQASDSSRGPFPPRLDLAASNDTDPIVADLNETIRLNPNDANAFKRRGDFYESQGRYHRAIYEYTKAIRLDPKYAGAFNGRGVCYHNNGAYDLAFADYDEAIRLDPRNAIFFRNRGNANRKRDQIDRAIADFDEAIRLDRKMSHAFLDRGAIYAQQRKYDRAIVDYDEAIRLKPTEAAFFYWRGSAYATKGQYDQAIADFNEAVRLHPKRANTFIHRGAAYASKAQYDHAIVDFSEAVRLDPNEADAFIRRGHAYYCNGHYELAVADLDEAIRLSPQSAIAFNIHGAAYDGRLDYDRAIENYNEAIKLDPTNAFYFTLRARVYADKAQYDRAISDYNEAVRLNPKDSVAYDGRGKAYAAKKDYEQAIADFDQAIRLDPHRAAAFNNRAVSYHEMGDYVRAIADYDQSIRLDPNYTEAIMSRAHVVEKKNKEIIATKEALGMDLGSAVAPVTDTLAGGIAGADAGSWLAQKGQDWVLDQLGLTPPRHPCASEAEQLLDTLAAFGTGEGEEKLGLILSKSRSTLPSKNAGTVAFQASTKGTEPTPRIGLITPEDEQKYGIELIGWAKRVASGALDRELSAVRREISGLKQKSGTLAKADTPPVELLTPEDHENYGFELTDLARRAAIEAFSPALNLITREIVNLKSSRGMRDKLTYSRRPEQLVTPNDEQMYGNDLIDLLKRAATEAVTSELDNISQEVANLRDTPNALHVSNSKEATEGSISMTEERFPDNGGIRGTMSTNKYHTHSMHRGKVATITRDDGSVVTLSMIKWGVLRRSVARMMKLPFIPRYETAIYDGHFRLEPYLTGLYADEESALTDWEELPKTIESVGLHRLQLFAPVGRDPLKAAYLHRGRVLAPDPLGRLASI